MHHDLLIIGAGSGNTIPGPEMSHWDIGIIERSAFGGTCLNRGCIPSKMLIYTADVAETVTDAARFGVEASLNGTDWPAIVRRVFGRIDPIAAGGATYRSSLPNVTVYPDDARFIGERTLEVGGTTVTADRIVLAAGARSNIPAIPGLDEVMFHTSDTILRIEKLPEHLIVIGGGFIAAELGHVFSRLGSHVTVINRGGALLELEDRDISSRFTALSAAHLDLVLGARIDGVRRAGNDIAVTVTVDGSERTITGDTLLIAAGRIPNGDELGVERSGVELDARGRVIVDSHGRTTAPGVWAIGDIVGRHQLKHMANSDARVIRHNLLHPDDPHDLDARPAPHAVFTSPQIGAIGLTEQDVERHGIDAVVITHDYASAAYGWAMEDTTSFVKLIGDPTTGLLLGAHIIGPQAASLVQLLVQGMHLGATIDDLATGQIYIHPALTEVVEQALLKLAASIRGRAGT